MNKAGNPDMKHFVYFPKRNESTAHNKKKTVQMNDSFCMNTFAIQK